MKFLSQVSNEQLQQLYDATANIFDGLSLSVGRKLMMSMIVQCSILPCVSNRRYDENALACKQDVENGKKLQSSPRLTAVRCSFSRSWLLITLLLR